MPRYTVVLTPEIEEGGYSVSVPALPGCVSQGETVEEAIANIRDAIGLYLWDEDLEARKETVPPGVHVTPGHLVTQVDAEPHGESPSAELLAETDPKIALSRHG
jgi:predicted RNase H-like HicB family nuclease